MLLEQNAHATAHHHGGTREHGEREHAWDLTVDVGAELASQLGAHQLPSLCLGWQTRPFSNAQENSIDARNVTPALTVAVCWDIEREQPDDWDNDIICVQCGKIGVITVFDVAGALLHGLPATRAPITIVLGIRSTLGAMRSKVWE
jgi:hypothetical protein